MQLKREIIILLLNDLTGCTCNTFNMDFGRKLLWRRVTRSRGNLPIHLSFFIHGSNRSVDGVKMHNSKPQDNLNGLPQRLFFLKKKGRFEQISIDGQTVYFGLSTINHSVIKKNGKRDALALQDLGILIKLSRGLRKEAQKRKRSMHSRKYLKISDQTRIKGKCKEFSEKRKDFNLMVTRLEVKLK